MFEKIRKMKNKKGFTLVELIVVLVILAILAALLVPALTGYIDRARNQSIIAETRSAVMAAQTNISTAYGKNTSTTALKDDNTSSGDTLTLGSETVSLHDIEKLAELETDTIKSVVIDKSGKITKLVYTSGSKTCTYEPANNKAGGNSDGDYNVS
jgi:prepilin-type N-terminal cleavage/methylation domain-containing protein